MQNIFNYIDRPSAIHKLTGATKFVCMVLWSFAAMCTYDTRMLAALAVLSFCLFPIGKIKLRDVSFMIGFTSAFLVLNTVLVYVFSPLHGTEIYGTCTYLTSYTGRFAPTAEQLFYQMNYILKFLATIPVVLLFISTTNPSEFASSLNKIGVSYSVSYAVALALRYIPDVQRQYNEISKASQARGIEMTKKAGLFARIKNVSTVLIPLVLNSMNRIDIISNAMELRGFGKSKKRTWYMGRRFRAVDILCMVVCAAMVGVSFYLNHINGSRFYNPFV